MPAAQFRKKPAVIEAVRYGKDDDGRWYSGAVNRVASFMLGLDADAQPTELEITSVVQPVGEWDPPTSANLRMWDGVAHDSWLPLAPGDWVIKGIQGEFYPCKPDIFASAYDAVSE